MPNHQGSELNKPTSAEQILAILAPPSSLVGFQTLDASLWKFKD